MKLKANTLYSKKKYSDALRLYQRIVQFTPEDVNILMRVASCFEHLQQKSEAINTLLYVADIYLKQGRSNLAVATLRRAEKMDPENVDIKEKLASAFIEERNYVDARRTLYELMNLFRKENRLIRVFETLQQLTHITPEDTDAKKELADVMIELGRNEDAFKALYELLQYAVKTEEYLLALESAQKIVESFPHEEIGDFLGRQVEDEFLRAYLTAWLTYVRGEHKKVGSILKKLALQQPDNAFVSSLLLESFGHEFWNVIRPGYLTCIRTCLEHERLEDARKLIHSAILTQPVDDELLGLALELSRSYPDKTHIMTMFEQAVYQLQEKDEPHKALKLLDQLVEFNPDYQMYVEERKRIIEKMGELPTMRFDLAVRLGSHEKMEHVPTPEELDTPVDETYYIEVQIESVEHALEEKNYQRAQNILNRLFKHYETHPVMERAYRLQHELYLKEGKTDEAVETLLKLSVLYKQWNQEDKVKEITAEIERLKPEEERLETLKSGDFEELSESLGFLSREIAAAVEPRQKVVSSPSVQKSGPVLEDEIEFEFEFEEPEQSKDEEVMSTILQFQEYVATGQREDAVAQLDLGIMHYNLGLYDEAVTPLMNAFEDARTHSQASLFLARCYLKKNKYDVATKYFLKASEVPNAPEYVVLESLYELGCLYEKEEQFEQAFHVFKKLYDMRPEYKDVRIRMSTLRPDMDLDI